MQLETLQETLDDYWTTLTDSMWTYDEDFEYHAFIAGGCIRSIMLYEKVKDIDIFCYSEEYAKKLRGIFKSVEGAYLSKNAISITLDGVLYQIVTTAQGNPHHIIEEFDFLMNMNFYDGDEVYVQSPQSIYSRTLDINPTCRNKLGTMARISKFCRRGYNAPDKVDMLRLAKQITELATITEFDQIVEHSKLYFNKEEFARMNFVRCPADYEASGANGKYRGSAV